MDFPKGGIYTALQKAKRKRAKLKIGVSGASGSGKTLSALLMAYGILKASYPELSEDEIWDKIAIIDTENESASLYSNRRLAGVNIGEFWTVDISPPFLSEKYLEAINDCKASGILICIVDSLTHLWDGEGGSLDKQYQIQKRTNNGYTAWREPKKEFKTVVDKILQSEMHFIVCMRAKMDHVQEKDPNTGKTVVRKVGMNPIAAPNSEYEFTLVFDIDADHVAGASKDRTGLFDGIYQKISPETGKKLVEWLNVAGPADAEGLKPVTPVSTGPIENNPNDDAEAVLAKIKKEITDTFKEKFHGDDSLKEKLYAVVASVNNGVKTWTKVKDIDTATAILEAVKAFEE